MYLHECTAKKKARMMSCDSTLQPCQILFCNFGNDADRDGFLLLFFGAGIFEGLELLVKNEAKL